MANPVQWSVDQLLSQLNAVKDKARAEWKTLGVNNAAVADLYARANQITDPAQRATVRRGLEAWAARQAKLQGDFNRGYAKWREAYNAVAAFMRSLGLNAPADSGGLGVALAAVIVPASIAALVITAGLWLGAVHEQNLTQRAGLASQASLLAARISGQISETEYLTASKAAAETANQQDKPNLISDIGGVLVPALLLVAAILIVPKLIPQRAAA